MATSVEVENRPVLSREELTCTPASLRGHIANLHFAPLLLGSIGVARYDMDLAHFRGIQLDWVAKKAYEILEEDEEATLRGFPKVEFWGKFNHRYFSYRDVRSYREMIVRNLMYMDQLGLASVDWERVEAAFPGARSVTLDIESDSTDDSFDPSKLAYPEHLRHLTPNNKVSYPINIKPILSNYK